MSKSLINIDTGRGSGIKMGVDGVKRRKQARRRRRVKKLRYVFDKQ